MAAPLRYPLILLAWGAMAAIYLPLLPAAGELVGAARSPAHWRALFADPQLGQALAATLVSTLLSVGGALLIALTIVAALWPSARWRRLSACCGWPAARREAMAGSGYRWSCRPCRWPTASTGWRCMPGLTVTGGPSCGAICCGWCPGCCLFCARPGASAIRG